MRCPLQLQDAPLAVSLAAILDVVAGLQFFLINLQRLTKWRGIHSEPDFTLLLQEIVQP